MSTNITTQSIETENQQQLPADTLSFSYCGGDKYSTKLEIAHESFADFSEKLSKPTVGAKDGPYIVRGPASIRSDDALDYGDFAIIDGDSSIDFSTGLVIPPDSTNYTGSPSPIVIHNILVELNITHCIVTTHSHTDLVNKCRVFIPYKTSSKQELDSVVDYLIAIFHQAGIPLADVNENHKWSQPWYMPRVASEQAHFEHYYHQGELINKADVDAWVVGNKASIESSDAAVSEDISSKSAIPYQPNDLDKACTNTTVKQFTELLENHDYLQQSTGTLNGEVSYQFKAPNSTSGSAGVNLFFCPESNCWVVKTHHGEHDLLNSMPNSFGNYAEAINALEHESSLDYDEKLALVNELMGGQIPRSIIQQVKIDVINDETAPFKPDVITALAERRKNNIADYIHDIKDLKAANANLSITDLKAAVNAVSKPKKQSTQNKIVNFVRSVASLFCDAEGKGYAEVPINGHTEYHLITSSLFKDFVSKSFYETTGSVLKKQDLNDAIYALNGMALYSNDLRSVYLRCAKYAGDYYIDLCNSFWQVVKVTTFDWEVLDHSPVPFIRNKNMRPLPFPIKSKVDLSRLADNTNLSGDNLTLVLAFILEALRIDTPFAIAEIIGCQGSAKSFTQNIIRTLIDPNLANLRAAPSSVEDVYISAKNNYMSSLNNVSRISAAIQDALCNLATGGGAAKRKLYSDDEENVFDVKSPIIMNGIVDLSTSNDLIERAVKITLPSIKSTNRKTEQTLETQLKIDIEFIYAGILDLFVETLAELPNINLGTLERMADLNILGAAMVKTPTYKDLGLNSDFVAIYVNNLKQATQNTLDSSPVALALQDYLNAHGRFRGTVKELLDKLALIKNTSDAWPKSPRGLSDTLKRLEVPLADVGITINRDGHSIRGSKLTITLDRNFLNKINSSKNDVHHVQSQSDGSDGDFGNVLLENKKGIFGIQSQGTGNELNIMQFVPQEIRDSFNMSNLSHETTEAVNSRANAPTITDDSSTENTENSEGNFDSFNPFDKK